MDTRGRVSRVEATALPDPSGRAVVARPGAGAAPADLESLRRTLYRPGAGRIDLERFVAAAGASARSDGSGPAATGADSTADVEPPADPTPDERMPPTRGPAPHRSRPAFALAAAIVLLIGAFGVASSLAPTRSVAAAPGTGARQGGRVLLNLVANGPRTFALAHADGARQVVVYVFCRSQGTFAWFLDGRGAGSRGVGLDAGHGADCSSDLPTSDQLDPTWTPDRLHVLIRPRMSYSVLVVAYDT